MNELPINKIICGDTLTELKKLPNDCIDLVITSPPYYGLRVYLPKDHPDYKKQIGLEESFEIYQERLLAVISEIKRVLKKTGQFWLNMGDCFGTGSGAGSRKGTKQATNTGSNYYEESGKEASEEAKCLMMMPERIAMALIDQQGFILRNKIKWAKQVLIKKENRTMGSVMPTSVKDRFNESGEELYFFVKSKKYYSDLDAVRLKNQVIGISDFRQNRGGFVDPKDLYDSKFNKFNYRVRDAKRKAGQPQFKASEEEISKYGKGSEYEQKYGEPWDRFGKKTLKARMDDTKNKDQKSSRTYNIKKLLSEVRLGIKPNTGMEEYGTGKSWHNHNQDLEQGQRKEGGAEVRLTYPLGKNLPTVWLIGSEPHNFQKELGSEIKTDHFAVFPEALCEIPIKFGCPKNGIVLDCFCGSGTALIVAKKLGRNYIGIELNKDYIKIAEARIQAIPQSLF